MVRLSEMSQGAAVNSAPCPRGRQSRGSVKNSGPLLPCNREKQAPMDKRVAPIDRAVERFPRDWHRPCFYLSQASRTLKRVVEPRGEAVRLTAQMKGTAHTTARAPAEGRGCRSSGRSVFSSLESESPKS